MRGGSGILGESSPTQEREGGEEERRGEARGGVIQGGGDPHRSSGDCRACPKPSQQAPLWVGHRPSPSPPWRWGGCCSSSSGGDLLKPTCSQSVRPSPATKVKLLANALKRTSGSRTAPASTASGQAHLQAGWRLHTQEWFAVEFR